MIVLAIARITILEAVRRRLVLALVVLTLLVVALSALVFQRLTGIGADGQPLPTVLVQLIASQLVIFMAFAFSGILALSSALVTAPSLAGEVDSGVALTILARPIRRSSVLLGKWLGLVTLLCVFTAGAGGLELLVVSGITGYSPPDPLSLLLYICAIPAILVTLTLFLTTRLAATTSGIVTIVLYFVCWMAGIAGAVGTAFGNDGLATTGTVSHLLVPTDVLWRGSLYAMEPSEVLAATRTLGARAQANPFLAASPPDLLAVGWCVLWVVLLLAAGVWSFNRREI